MNLFFEIVLGLALFAIFERRHVRVLAGKFVALRGRLLHRGAARELASALAAAGYFDALAPQEVDRVRAAIETSGYGGIFEHPWRVLRADDEDLAEGCVGDYLRLWAPSLERLGIAPLVGESRFVDGGAHVLDLPDEVLTLVSDAEARLDEPGQKYGFSRGAVAARLLQRLNDDLAAAGRADRLYSVYSGNDAQALLLTPPMLTAILAMPGVRRDELPYIRTPEWPNFGLNAAGTLR